MRSITIIFILCLLASCAKKKPEEVNEAIDVAQTYLSESKCDEAIELLEKEGRQDDNAIYLQVLASAYACRAGFSEIEFIGNDVDTLQTDQASDLFKSLTLLSLSGETETDSATYEDMSTARGVLLSPATQAARTAKFGSRKAGDMGIQALLLSIVQLGKFIHLFGNADASGVKGQRVSSGNTCFLNYTYSNAQAVVSALPAANHCNSNSAGHPDLDITTDDGKRRACEGLVILNTTIDILENIDLTGVESLESLSEVAEVASSMRDTAIAADPDLETLLTTMTQSACIETLESADERENMQLIFAFIFESGLE